LPLALFVAQGNASAVHVAYPKLVDWVKSNIIETLTFCYLPRAHQKHLKSTNMLERLNDGITRRTPVVRSSRTPNLACG